MVKLHLDLQVRNFGTMISLVPNRLPDFDRDEVDLTTIRPMLRREK